MIIGFRNFENCTLLGKRIPSQNFNFLISLGHSYRCIYVYTYTFLVLFASSMKESSWFYFLKIEITFKDIQLVIIINYGYNIYKLSF